MLLGITGRAGTGKDTLADQLVSHDVYEKYRFADPIKAMLTQFHIKPDVWDDRIAKEKPIPWLGVSPRYMAQTLGTEWGRDLIHPDIWLLMAKGRWHHLNADGNGRMVVADVRFPNEAEWIQEAGGLLIKLERSDAPAMDNAGHSSEDGVPPEMIDIILSNNGTPQELRENMWQAVKDALGVEQ